MTQRHRILSPYTQRVDDGRQRLIKFIFVSGLLLLAVLLGLLIGLFGLQAWFLASIPIVLMVGLAAWLAPELGTDLNRQIGGIFIVYAFLLLCWPRYIAFNTPGLPWISLQRLAMMALVPLFLMQLATSQATRQRITDIMAAQPRFSQIFLAWVFLHFVMLFVGRLNGLSIWIDQSLIWHLAFIMAAYLASFEGVALRFSQIAILASVLTALLVIPEVMQLKPIWLDHLPAFLSIDDQVLAFLADGKARANAYRARSIFAESVTYAEYIGMMLPFVLLAILRAPTALRKTLAIAAALLLLVAAIQTNARTAMIGFIVGSLSFFALWAVRRYQFTRKNRDILSPALIFSVPVLAAFLPLFILSSRTLTRRFFGGGEHVASNEGRIEQWEMAIPQIIKNPLGYGMGQLKEIVPYYDLNGLFTIDSYPINLIIEFGVLGFLLFMALFLFAIIIGIRLFLSGRTAEHQIAGAAACSLIAFLTARTVLSTTGGQALAFLLAGLILGLYWRIQQTASTRQA